MQTMPKMYDTVWYMKNNTPQSSRINSIKMTANSSDKTAHHIVVELSDNTSHNIANIFDSKDELMFDIFKLIPSRISQAEQYCLDIYDDFDSTEILKQTISVQYAWKAGGIIHNTRSDL